MTIQDLSGSIFPTKEMYLFKAREDYEMSCKKSGILRIAGMSDKMRREHKINNMHLIERLRFTDDVEFPVMNPYNGPVDYKLCPYNTRSRSTGKGEAAHFFIKDSKFAIRLWQHLEVVTHALGKFDLLFAPDYSMYVDCPAQVGKWATYQRLFVGAFWQSIGYNVVPTATWGDVDSFKYSFKGLPTHSIIAVSGQGHNKYHADKLLWQYALREIEEQLLPTLILVYGEPEDVPGLNTELRFMQDYIHSKLKRL